MRVPLLQVLDFGFKLVGCLFPNLLLITHLRLHIFVNENRALSQRLVAEFVDAFPAFRPFRRLLEAVLLEHAQVVGQRLHVRVEVVPQLRRDLGVLVLQEVRGLVLRSLEVLRAEKGQFLSHFLLQLTQKLCSDISDGFLVEKLQSMLLCLFVPFS